MNEEKEEGAFDIEYALEALNILIKKIYIRVNNKSQDEDLSGKTALDMLTDIETKAMIDIEKLTSHAKGDAQNLNSFENE